MSGVQAAVVGAGFIGPVHVEGLRRAGVGVTGILGVDAAESERAAATLGLPRAYRSFDEVLGDPAVGSVHLAVPNRLHFAMAKAALAAGKHVLCEKPLAMNSRESAALVKLAAKAKVAAGVNYNIRYYPLCIEAADRARRGELGEVFHVAGSYVQDWLFHETDYNWRVLAEEGGDLRAVADIGTHWLDLIHAITGLEVEEVSADLKTVYPVRRRPKGEVETFSGKRARPRATEPVRITTDDYGCVMLRFAGGGPRVPLGLAGHGRPQELPSVRDRRVEAGPRVGERASERALDRPPRPAERVAPPRSGPGRRRRPPVHPLPRRPQRGVPGHVQAVFPRVLWLHRRGGFCGPADVPDVRRRAPRNPPLRGDPAEPSQGRMGQGQRRDSMKLGFVSAILPDLGLEEVLGFAAREGYECVELMCWPKGKAERRYAGVTHLDVTDFGKDEARRVLDLVGAAGVAVSGLGYYPNPLAPDAAESKLYVGHIKRVIHAAARLGVNQVNTFIGRDWTKSVDANWPRFLKVWKPLVRFAEDQGVRIGIENCPMLFTGDEWPGGKNLATTPAIWRRMFEAIPSPSFGLNYDPSHLVWQHIDYVRPLREFAARIFHVHAKDVRIDQDRLDEVGILAPPLQYHSPKLPGLGEVTWGRFLSVLGDVGYRGPVCVEVEDRAYEESLETRQAALRQSAAYLRQFMPAKAK